MNKGTSTYHCVQGLYWRDTNGTLLACEGRYSDSVCEAWPSLWEDICAHNDSWTSISLPSNRQLKTLSITADIPSLHHIRSSFPLSYREELLRTTVSELKEHGGRVLGMVTSQPQSLVKDDFSIWARHFFLLETQFQPFAQFAQTACESHQVICEAVTDIFERRLKNVSKNDQWNFGGRDSFVNRVYGFVEKGLPILFALPAFPCKSPNPSKVGGTMPDLAEQIAMDVLHGFIEEVRHVYKPGATMWIISDGHVFSDCIGVNDPLVDAYDKCMMETDRRRYPTKDEQVPFVQFKGLQDIFSAKTGSVQGLQESSLQSYTMPHPVKTEITYQAELCRKLMLCLAEADRTHIRACIEEQVPDVLSLYRGQTRFMLEDLADVPSVKGLSVKQRKKTAALVAQEMMSRNQAYSNLVELLLPNHVRLSIHAHDNRGPKFAVRLLPKDLVRPIENLETRFEPVAAYEFQLPTPWHNSIIKVEGDEMLYLGRSKVATTAVAGLDFEGSWVETSSGAHYLLKRVSPPQATQDVISASEPAPETTKAPVAVGQPSMIVEKKAAIITVTPLSTRKRADSIFAQSVVKGKWKLFIPLPPFAVSGIMRSVWRYWTLGA